MTNGSCGRAGTIVDPAHRTAWFDELAVVEAALTQELQSGEVLELACGTGLWSQHLARRHSRVSLNRPRRPVTIT